MKRHRTRNLLVGDQTLLAVGGEKGLGTRLILLWRFVAITTYNHSVNLSQYSISKYYAFILYQLCGDSEEKKAGPSEF